MFNPYSDSFFIIYVVDILVYSRNQEEHKQHLRIVFLTLRDHKLYAKFSKCLFWLDSIIFIGHVVSNDSIMLDPVKINCIHDWS